MVLSNASRRYSNLISLLNAVVVPPLIALIVSGSLVALLMRGRAASLALDLPNQRSLHSTPTPRLGGVGIVAGIAAAWAYTNPPVEPLLLAALGLWIGVSLLDDLKDGGVPRRLMSLLNTLSVSPAIGDRKVGGSTMRSLMQITAATPSKHRAFYLDPASMETLNLCR